MLNVGQSTSKWANTNDISCEFIETTTSTNDLAKQKGHQDQSQWIYITNLQTKGRGRHQNTWTNTDAGNQLLISWCFNLEKSPQPISSPVFGWAVYKSINDEFDLNLSIKAPNDIYINSKKAGGILLESVTQGHKHFICVGLGLNINSSPEDLKISTSLAEEIGKPVLENRWQSFLSALESNLNEAALMCQAKELSPHIKEDILTALKRWPMNNVSKILPNGDLITVDNQTIPWTNL